MKYLIKLSQRLREVSLPQYFRYFDLIKMHIVPFVEQLQFQIVNQHFKPSINLFVASKDYIQVQLGFYKITIEL